MSHDPSMIPAPISAPYTNVQTSLMMSSMMLFLIFFFKTSVLSYLFILSSLIERQPFLTVYWHEALVIGRVLIIVVFQRIRAVSL